METRFHPLPARNESNRFQSLGKKPTNFLVPVVGSFLAWTILSSAIPYAWRVRSLSNPQRVVWSVTAAAANLVFYGFAVLVIDGLREGSLQALLELL